MAEKVRPPAPFVTKILLWFVLALLYLPLIVMLIGAVYAREGDGTMQVTLHWFWDVLTDPALMQSLLNSFIVALTASVLATTIGTFGALAISRSSKRGKWILEGLNMISLIFPEIVFALSLLSWFFILTFELGLTTVIIAHVTFSLSYVMMTVVGRLQTLDRSYEDAARDLGASESTILWKVTLPLLKPALIAGFMLSFLLSFDDFLITYFVNGVGSDTLPVKLYASLKMGVSPKLNALSSLMFILTLIVFFVFNRTGALNVLFDGGSDKKREES